MRITGYTIYTVTYRMILILTIRRKRVLTIKLTRSVVETVQMFKTHWKFIIRLQINKL